MRKERLWVALAIVALSLLGSSAALYARFYNVEWRMARVEERLGNIEDTLDRRLPRKRLSMKEK